MANSVVYKEKKLAVGDTISIDYRIKEGDKERIQIFSGILMKIRGESAEGKMITVRKMSRSGIGIERVISLNSPFIADIKLDKKSENRKSKIYFIRALSDQELRSKLYKKKTLHNKSTKPTRARKTKIKS